MHKLVLVTFIGLGLATGLYDRRTTAAEVAQLGAVTALAYGLCVGMGEVARRREARSWLGMTRQAWLAYPPLAWAGSLAIVLVYRFAWPR